MLVAKELPSAIYCRIELCIYHHIQIIGPECCHIHLGIACPVLFCVRFEPEEVLQARKIKF